MKTHFVVAIDGPAGSGKSTAAKFISKKLNLFYIDTGAMYRAVTLAVIKKKINLDDTAAIVRLAKKCRIGLKPEDNGIKVLLNSRDATKAIRSSRVNACVSFVAKIKEIRAIMVLRQRNLSRGKNVVLEGRDIGTVVFPKAKYKFYLDASVDERSRRRFKEMRGVTIETVKANVEQRDTIDSLRETGPLKKAKDAVYIDTTKMTIEEVVNKILENIKQDIK